MIFSDGARALGDVAGAVYWVRGSLDFRESPPQIAGLALLICRPCSDCSSFSAPSATGLAVSTLLLHSNGVVFGLRYVDHVLWQPGLWLLVVLSLIAAAMCFANVRERGLKLPVAAAALLFAPAIVLNLLQPVIERLWVKPDELRVEQPYLERNIEMTRRAYQLDGVDVKPFAGLGQLTPASLTQDSATVKNIRLWDPRPLIATYKQLQEIRLYYDFRGVDIDRYWINGEYTEVMLSGRELNPDLLPTDAQTWVNRHLKFTHGYGLVMSPVHLKDQEGLPILSIKNIPPASTTGFQVTQPRIYYGEEPDSYAIVKAQTPEFDYPHGNDNVYDFYKGSGGVPVSGLIRRILLSFYFRDINLLVTGNIIPGSEVMLRRNISQRVAYVAPFLNQDNDPYLVVHDGGLYWIIDCYTVSDHYPVFTDERRPDQLYSQFGESGGQRLHRRDRFLRFRSRRPDNPHLGANLPRYLQDDGRYAARSAHAYPLSRRLFCHSGGHLSDLSHDRSGGLLQ